MKTKNIIQGVAYLLCLGLLIEVFINNYNKSLVITVLIIYIIVVMFINHLFKDEE